MSWRETLEKNVIWFALTLLATGFGVGWAAHAILLGSADNGSAKILSLRVNRTGRRKPERPTGSLLQIAQPIRYQSV